MRHRQRIQLLTQARLHLLVRSLESHDIWLAGKRAFEGRNRQILCVHRLLRSPPDLGVTGRWVVNPGHRGRSLDLQSFKADTYVATRAILGMFSLVIKERQSMCLLPPATPVCFRAPVLWLPRAA